MLTAIHPSPPFDEKKEPPSGHAADVQTRLEMGQARLRGKPQPENWGFDKGNKWAGWWYTYPSEKYESNGIIVPNIWKKHVPGLTMFNLHVEHCLTKCGFHQHCCVTSILIVISPETMLPKQNFNLTTWYDPEEVCINVEYHMDSWLAGHENHKFQLRGHHGQWGLNHPTGFGQGQRSKMISTYIFLLVLNT